MRPDNQMARTSRQRTTAPTAEDYVAEVEVEESVGVPSTIQVPCDALSVEPEPRIPLKIEVLKIRGPSTRRTRTSMVQVGEESGAGLALDYDEFLYGSGSLSPRLSLPVAPAAPAALQPTKILHTTCSVEKEQQVLAELGRTLVHKAREASTRHKRSSKGQGPPTTRGRAFSATPSQTSTSTSAGTRALTRSNSVPSIASISAREAVDNFHLRRTAARLTHNPNAKEIDLSVCEDAQSHSDILSHSHTSLLSTTVSTASIITQPTSLSMIFASRTCTHPQAHTKQLSSRTVLTHTNSTATGTSTASFTTSHHHNNNNNNNNLSLSELGNSSGSHGGYGHARLRDHTTNHNGLAKPTTNTITYTTTPPPSRSKPRRSKSHSVAISQRNSNISTNTSTNLTLTTVSNTCSYSSFEEDPSSTPPPTNTTTTPANHKKKKRSSWMLFRKTITNTQKR